MACLEALPRDIVHLIALELEPAQRFPLLFLKCFHRVPSVRAQNSKVLDFCRAVARSGVISQLEWAQRAFRAPMNKPIYCEEAAANGRIGLFIWLKELSCPYTFKVAILAAENSQIEFLRWFLENSPTDQLVQNVLYRLQSIALTHFSLLRYPVARAILELIVTHSSKVVPRISLPLQCLFDCVQCLIMEQRLAQAEAVCADLLARRIAFHGECHEQVIDTIEWLAKIHLDQGHFDEAIKFYRSAAEKRLALQGENGDLLRVRSNLGYILYTHGRFAEAEAMHREVLAARIRLLGEGSASVAVSRALLSVSLRAQKRDTESDEIIESLLAQYPPGVREDSDLILCWETLAKSLLRAQLYNRAEDLYRRVLLYHIDKLGNKHFHTIAAMQSLAETLYKQNRGIAEAETLMQTVLEVRMKRFGAEHPLTVSAMKLMASRGETSDASVVQSYYSQGS